jgi:hypothetical protein
MERHELAVTELSSLLRMIQVIPDSDSVSRVHQMLLAFCTSWSTIGMRRAVLFAVDSRGRMLRGHLASERAEEAAGQEPSFDALARRVVESTEHIECGDLTLRTRTFGVPLDWLRSGAVKGGHRRRSRAGRPPSLRIHKRSRLRLLPHAGVRRGAAARARQGDRRAHHR